MWSEEEQRRLRELGVEPARSDRNRISALVTHFKRGGTLYSVLRKGVPVKASQTLARKVRGLVNLGKLDRLVVSGPLGSMGEGESEVMRLSDAARTHQQALLGLVGHLRRAVHTAAIDLEPSPVDFGLDSLAAPGNELPSRSVLLLWRTQADDFHPSDPLGGMFGERGEGVVQVLVQRGDPVAIRLAADGSVTWTALREHLGDDDSLWRELDSWRERVVAECRARADLNRTILRRAERLFGMKVLQSSPQGMPRLTPTMVLLVRVEATRRALGEPPTDFPARIQLHQGELQDPLTSKYLCQYLDEGNDPKGKLATSLRQDPGR